MSTPENRTPRSEQSAEVRGRTHRGQECALVNASGDALPREELERLLADLIAADAFGFRATGEPGGAIRIDRPAFGHVQVGERLYRLIVERYRARLEKF
jgi:hypothetical protein